MTMTADAPPVSEYEPNMPIGRVHPDPINPRTHVDVDDDFIASIAAGIIEPLIVRPDHRKDTLLEDPEDFLVVAGERRLTGAAAAKLETVPCIIRHDLADDADALEAMIIENGHRENLPPLDEARAFATLVEKGRTQRDIARAVGREQGTVSKRLSLLKLPARAQQLLDDQRITVKTALGMTGLIKDNGRLSKVLDYAAQNPTADDQRIGEHVFRQLEDVNHTKNAAKVEKAKEKKIAELKARGLVDLEELEDDPDHDDVVYEDCDEADATAFQVWCRGTEIVVDWCRVEQDENAGAAGETPAVEDAPAMAPATAAPATDDEPITRRTDERILIASAARDYVAQKVALDTDDYTDDTLSQICRVDSAWAALAEACGYELPDESDDRLTGEEVDPTVALLDEGDEWERRGGDNAPMPEEPLDEPFKAYNAFPVKSIVNIVNNPDTTVERLQAVVAYEEANRANGTILDAARARLDQLSVAS